MNIKTSQYLVDEAKKKITTLQAKEAKELHQKGEIKFIDIRDIRELWKEGTIKGSMHIPRGMLEFWLDPESSYYKERKVGQIKKMVLFCALGLRSALATKSLMDMGFTNVVHVEGGFDALKDSGLEIVKKEKK
jgi:rhodanese-related sulfurtransferase|tara:strand:+ start:1194 stop:1592 length:399 start_codon:yes stop_codon:yes gene_type:complete